MKWLRHRYQPCKPLGADGTRISGSKEHIDLSRKAAEEGVVLLKNEGILPLVSKKIVLLGKASEEYVKGGGGSGDVYCRYVLSPYEAFKKLEEEGKVLVYDGLHGFYDEKIQQQHKDGFPAGMTKELLLDGHQLKDAASYSDTAVVFINRFSGEGWDRYCDTGKPVNLENVEPDCWDGERILREMGKEVFERGDFYLSKNEEQLISDAKLYFRNIVVVLNVGGMVDSSWFYDDDKIQAVLFAGQGGMEGALAAAEIICGSVNPSGKLTDTFARRLEDYPSTDTFHQYNDAVEYTEDVYVGYRYFETVPEKKSCVNYPFGFGLSYTKFLVQMDKEIPSENTAVFRISVKNIGNIPGKEVVQLYFSSPSVKIDAPSKQLAAFAKTKLLDPGEIQIVELTVDFSSLASYDDTGVINKSAWVLEVGEYSFWYGTSVRDVSQCNTNYVVREDTVVKQCSQKLTPSELTKRMKSDGTYTLLDNPPHVHKGHLEYYKDTPEKLEGAIPGVRKVDRGSIFELFKSSKTLLDDVASRKISLDAFMETLSDEDLANLLCGQPATGVANTYGIGGSGIRGIPSIMTADGPAGLRLAPELELYTTAWPCATTLACTWNTELVRNIGQCVAREVKENNIGIYLAPGMNIHRSPLCGRNFEYYSEDPLVTGLMASAAIKGIQSENICATPKHFAFNNKETNRKHSDSIVSERAAREIYLKGFEIAVKQAKPWAIMSSYNIVNGVHTSENKELLTDILRDEWGYEGFVMTDWWTRGIQTREVKAGNDVKMAAGYPEDLLEDLKNGNISRDDLKVCAKRVLQMILKQE